MLIEINDVSKKIKGALILKHVTLQFKGGLVYGFQGPNGSGKTMLLRLVAGLILPTEGEVLIDGARLGRDVDFPPSVGLLIENPAFLPGYTGKRNLELLADLRGRVGDREICEAICGVGVDPEDKRKYRKYSLGMKQRLGVAAAIMEKPDLLLLDEPTNALDEKGVEMLCALIRRERDRGACVLVACHDREILDRLADEIYTVQEGCVERRPL